MIWEIIGWIGTVMLMLCIFPQAVKTYRDGNANGMSAYFITLWIAGSLLTLTYLLALHPSAIPVIMARVLNFFPLGVIVYFKFRPRNTL